MFPFTQSLAPSHYSYPIIPRPSTKLLWFKHTCSREDVSRVLPFTQFGSFPPTPFITHHPPLMQSTTSCGSNTPAAGWSKAPWGTIHTEFGSFPPFLSHYPLSHNSGSNTPAAGWSKAPWCPIHTEFASFPPTPSITHHPPPIGSTISCGSNTPAAGWSKAPWCPIHTEFASFPPTPSITHHPPPIGSSTSRESNTPAAGRIKAPRCSVHTDR